MLKKCDNCDSVIVKGKQTFHKFDCPHNTLTLAEWKNEEFHRSDKLLKSLQDELKYEEEINGLTFGGLAEELINNFWAKEEIGSRNSVLINKVIEFLQELEDITQKTRVKTDRGVGTSKS